MIIDLIPLRKKDLSLKGVVTVEQLALEKDPYIRLHDDVHCALKVACPGDELLVRGSLYLDMECLCARCGVWYKHRVEVPDFVRSFQIDSNRTVIDLTDDIREDIILAFPSNWLCRVDCRGVCAQCGVNHNDKNCDCEQKHGGESHSQWQILDRVLPKE